MLSEALLQGAAQRKSQSIFVTAPIRGWNTTDPAGIMTPEYAIKMINFLPLEYGLETRGGSKIWCVGLEEEVQTIMSWTSSNEKVFAVAGGKIFDVGLYSEDQEEEHKPVKLHENLKSSELQCVTFANNGGAFLWCCNGVDRPIFYRGEPAFERAEIYEKVWNAEEEKDENVEIFPANVAVYQNRLFFCIPGSLVLYYLGTDSVMGQAFPLPLGAYVDRGGYIMAVGNVTIDGGYGPDDYLVVVTSEGEVLGFKGRNPDTASAWAMTGKFQISRPLGRRCMCKWGGDLVIMTEAGVAGISSMLSNELAGLTQAATHKIQPTWAAQTRTYGARPGWDICVYHRRGLMILNAPDRTGFKQLFFNPTTVAWAEVKGWEKAYCFHEFKGQLLAGMNGRIQILDVGASDITPSADGKRVEAPIYSVMEQAFIQPTGGGMKARYTLMRPYLTGQARPNVFMSTNTDNRTGMYAARKIMDASERDSVWYESEWYVDDWAVTLGPTSLYQRWAQAIGTGYSVSLGIEIETKFAPITYTGSDLQFVVSNAL